MPEEEG
jgi:hypothetical protein